MASFGKLRLTTSLALFSFVTFWALDATNAADERFRDLDDGYEGTKVEASFRLDVAKETIHDARDTKDERAFKTKELRRKREAAATITEGQINRKKRDKGDPILTTSSSHQDVENPLMEKRRKEVKYSKEDRRKSVMAIVICVVCLAVALLIFLIILDCGRTKEQRENHGRSHGDEEKRVNDAESQTPKNAAEIASQKSEVTNPSGSSGRWSSGSIEPVVGNLEPLPRKWTNSSIKGSQPQGLNQQT